MDRELAAIIAESIDSYLKSKDINIHNGVLNSYAKFTSCIMRGDKRIPCGG